MRVPRIPIGFLMLTVGFVGAFLAEVRALLVFDMEQISNISVLSSGSPILAVSNLLIFLLALRLPEVWRTRRLRARPFWWGFQAASWGSLVVFGTICLALDDMVFEFYVWPDDSPIGSARESIDAFLNHTEWQWLEPIFEFGFPATLFGVPILLIGLLGGLMAWALGIDVDLQFHRRRRGKAGAVAEPVPRESLAP